MRRRSKRTRGKSKVGPRAAQRFLQRRRGVSIAWLSGMQLKRVCGATVLVVMSGFAATACWIDRVGSAAAEPVAGCPIVVLGARVDPGGLPSPTLEERVREGVRLQRQLGGILLFSGGVGDHPPAEADVGRELALQAGVAAAFVATETRSHSTRENARESAVLLRQLSATCVNLVSDPYHLARARWAFEREGLEQVHLVPVTFAPRHRVWSSRLGWTLREVPALLKLLVLDR